MVSSLYPLEVDGDLSEFAQGKEEARMLSLQSRPDVSQCLQAVFFRRQISESKPSSDAVRQLLTLFPHGCNHAHAILVALMLEAE